MSPPGRTAEHDPAYARPVADIVHHAAPSVAHAVGLDDGVVLGHVSVERIAHDIAVGRSAGRPSSTSASLSTACCRALTNRAVGTSLGDADHGGGEQAHALGHRELRVGNEHFAALSDHLEDAYVAVIDVKHTAWTASTASLSNTRSSTSASPLTTSHRAEM